MSSTKLHPLIQQTENYLECWKQFNHFINMARSKKFGSDDETHFLEIKSVLVQELELTSMPARKDEIQIGRAHV